jgi:hypothetical protein
MRLLFACVCVCIGCSSSSEATPEAGDSSWSEDTLLDEGIPLDTAVADVTQEATTDVATETAPPKAKLGPPFLAVGYGTVRAISNDGKSWTDAPPPSPLPAGFSGAPVSGDNEWLLRGGCWGGPKGMERFIAVGGTGGDKGLMLSSADGTSWDVLAVHANDDCAWGNGLWVFPTRTSTDGKTFVDSPTQASCRQMVFGAGIFVSVGDHEGGNVTWTADGKHWTELPITYVGTGSARKGYNRVAYGNGRFLAVNLYQKSPVFSWDGKGSFTEKSRMETFGEDLDIQAVTYGRGAFFIASNDSLWSLKDGETTWKKSAVSGAPQLYNLTVTDDLFFTENAWSTDGAKWTASTKKPGDGINEIIATER